MTGPRRDASRVSPSRASTRDRQPAHDWSHYAPAGESASIIRISAAASMQLRARSRIIEDATNPSGHFDQAPPRPMSPKRPRAGDSRDSQAATTTLQSARAIRGLRVAGPPARTPATTETSWCPVQAGSASHGRAPSRSGPLVQADSRDSEVPICQSSRHLRIAFASSRAEGHRDLPGRSAVAAGGPGATPPASELRRAQRCSRVLSRRGRVARPGGAHQDLPPLFPHTEIPTPITRRLPATT